MLLAALALAVDTRTERVEDPLFVGPIWDIAQDDAGWIWVAGVAGLSRWDGAARRWGGDDARDEVTRILRIDGDVVTVLMRDQRLLRVWPDHAEVIGTALDASGRWTLDDHLSFDGARFDVPVTSARHVWEVPGGAWVAGDALIEVAQDGTVLQTWPLPRISAVAPGWAGDVDGHLYRLDDGALRRTVNGRILGIVPDGDGLWLVLDHDLVWLDGDEAVTLHVPGDIPNTAPLLVDREGSLWLGSFVGLEHRPSPRTFVWDVRDGLPMSGAMSVDLVDGEVWVAGWGGSAVISGGGVRRDQPGVAQWPTCTDGTHTYTTGWPDSGLHGPPGLYRLGRPSVRLADLPDGVQPRSCSVRNGRFWLATESGVLEGEPGAGFRPVAWPRDGAWFVIETADGTVFGFDQGIACSAAATELLSGGAWRCEDLPAQVGFRHAAEVEGQLWAVGERAGVWRHADRWTELDDSALPTRTLFTLSPSPRGGVWLGAIGAVWRVAPSGGGWDVLETLDTWNGLPGSAGLKVAEDASGAVWVATAEGVARVPASERGAPGVPVRPVVAALNTDGRPGDSVGWPENTVELTGRVASWRDQGRLWWRFALDGDWAPPSRSPVRSFADLSAGPHQLAIAASLDGEHWSAPTDPVSVTVVLPWYLRWPTLCTAALALGAGAWGVHRMRVAAAVQVERERTRIAMDLHDELGSGLGTLALLGDLAASDELDEGGRRDVAGQLSTVAASLGDALSNIVWALRRDAGSTVALTRALAERGGRLFADGRCRFQVDIPPDLPERRLPLQTWRTAQLVALEALANAARHADARHVWLVVRSGPRWSLTVDDDGRGLETPSPRAGTGTGLEAMRQRAAQIGGGFSVGPRPGGGTRVRLEFDA